MKKTQLAFRHQYIVPTLHTLQAFVKAKTSSGILLLLCTVLSLLIANSVWADTFEQMLQTEFIIGLGKWTLHKPLILWINDGLMAVFFFMVGLEIKREILVGDLASFEKASLPIFAAIGGMIVPAIFYSLFNWFGQGKSGWGIPMATDIAFALGILYLIGKNVPFSLKIFLTALAIVDDIGAAMVIALFYTAEISWISLAGAGLIMVLLIACNMLRIRYLGVYIVLGLLLWFAFLKSGIHPTIAGVLLAFCVPSHSRINILRFLHASQRNLNHIRLSEADKTNTLLNEHYQHEIYELSKKCTETLNPLNRFTHALHFVVPFLIIPIFAMANANISLAGDWNSMATNWVCVGIVAGLALGKPLGIVLFSWLSVRLHFASLPIGVNWRQILGVAHLGGIGFTMSIFIANLAFVEAELLSIAKVGILFGSTASALLGWAVLKSMRTVKNGV